MFKLIICLFLSVLGGCTSTPRIKYRSVSFDEIPNWKSDKFLEALPAFQASCQKSNPRWTSFCLKLNQSYFETDSDFRQFLEKNLSAYQLSVNHKDSGLITGYYEAELTGSRYRLNEKQVPIYGLPYSVEHQMCSREDILNHPSFKAPIIAYADNMVDLFILQVQGSGRLITPQGQEIRLGYAGNNAQQFKGIGTIMKEEGLLTAGMASMPAMREWLKKNPQKANELMAQNPRYIYFKEMTGETPIGSAGVVLTPKRSLAVDTKYIPLHTPIFLTTTAPDGTPIYQLMMAQDTGADIKGAIRGDFFWGHGEQAFQTAGKMKSSGKFYILEPK